MNEQNARSEAPTAAPKKKDKRSVASVVFGAISAVCLTVIPISKFVVGVLSAFWGLFFLFYVHPVTFCFSFLGVLCAVIGVVLAKTAIRRAREAGDPIGAGSVGLALSALALFYGLIQFVFNGILLVVIWFEIPLSF